MILSQVPASRRQGTIFHEWEGSTGSQDRACRWLVRILADENPHRGTLTSPVCCSGTSADNFCHTSSKTPHGHHTSPHDSRAPEGCWPTSRELCASTRAHGRTRTHCRPPSTAPPYHRRTAYLRRTAKNVTNPPSAALWWPHRIPGDNFCHASIRLDACATIHLCRQEPSPQIPSLRVRASPGLLPPRSVR